MISNHSGNYLTNIAWFKDVFKDEDVIFSNVSALEVLGLFVGYVNEDKIYVYAKQKGKYENVQYTVIDELESIDHVIKNGIKCTSISKTFNDMLRDTDDMQALIEGLSNYYHDHHEKWDGLLIDEDNLNKFNHLKNYAVDYYSGG